MVGLYALLPYVSLAVLPLTGLALAIGRGRLVATLKDPHLYGAALLSAVLFAVLQYVVATGHEPSWEAWRAQAADFFVARRRHALSGGVFDPVAFGDRLTKLWHQHFFHAWDNLGDWRRNDHLWTLPAPHVVWLGFVPVGIFGAWRAWKARDGAAAVFAAVLLPTYALALTIGFPEGRYLLAAVPCLSYFVLSGVRALAGTRPTLKTALLAGSLAAVAANSFVAVRGDYNTIARKRWHAMAGMREAVDLIHREYGREYGFTKDLHLSWPDLSYESWLYLEMLGNMRVRPFGLRNNLAEVGAGEPLFAVAEDTETAVLQGWKARAFRVLGQVEDRPSGRRFVVLFSAPG